MKAADFENNNALDFNTAITLALTNKTIAYKWYPAITAKKHFVEVGANMDSLSVAIVAENINGQLKQLPNGMVCTTYTFRFYSKEHICSIKDRIDIIIPQYTYADVLFWNDLQQLVDFINYHEQLNAISLTTEPVYQTIFIGWKITQIK